MANIRLNKIVFIALCISFFCLYSFLILNNNNLRFSWPDEMSNYYFINQFKNTNHLNINQPYVYLGVNIISPRSVNIINGSLTPSGFIGLPIIWGIFAKVIGIYLILFLTPLLAVVCSYFFYRSVSILFNEQVGFISGVLLLTFAPFIYYSTFVLLPNIAFIAFLILSLYFLIFLLTIKNSYIYYLLSVFFLSLALFIRPSELVWIAVLYLCIFILNFKKFSWKKILLSLPAILFVGGVQLYVNLITYGSYFSFGYSRYILNKLNTAEINSNFLQKIYTLFFPFGIHLKTALYNFDTYIFSVNWIFFILAVFGIVTFIHNYQVKLKNHYLMLLGGVFTYLLIYYCSWQLSDTLILSDSRLGVSYNRYLLPIMIGFLPLIGYFVYTILNNKKLIIKLIGISLVIGYVIVNSFYAYAYGNDSLLKIKKSIKEYNELHELVIKMTSNDSVIITKRGDKIIFPQRNVISQYGDDEVVQINKLLETKQLYYLSFKDEELIQNLNESLFADNFIEIINKEDLKYGYDLYEVKRK